MFFSGMFLILISLAASLLLLLGKARLIEKRTPPLDFIKRQGSQSVRLL